MVNKDRVYGIQLDVRDKLISVGKQSSFHKCIEWESHGHFFLKKEYQHPQSAPLKRLCPFSGGVEDIDIFPRT